MLCATWNAPEEAFNDDNQTFFGGKSQSDLLFSISQGYKFCGMEIMPGFNCHDVLKNPRFEQYIEGYKKHLEALM